MLKTRSLIQDGRMFFCLITVIAMSAYDAVATMEHIKRGIALEGNPFMASLIRADAVTFFLVKMALTTVCLVVCYSYSHLRVGRVGIQVAVIAYSVICLYHAVIVLLR